MTFAMSINSHEGINHPTGRKMYLVLNSDMQTCCFNQLVDCILYQGLFR